MTNLDDLKTLHIIKDGTTVDMSLKDIFDTEKYDSFVGITYSISAKFVNEYLSSFKNIEIVVGIQDDVIRGSINKSAKVMQNNIKKIFKNEQVKTYEGLSTEMKQKLTEKMFDVKISNTHIIHSKFYLMSNSETGENRVVVGSANLSLSAFEENSKQFENILIFDNSYIYDIYNAYYKEMQAILSPYFPTELVKINAKKIREIKKTEVDLESVVKLTGLTAEEIEKIQETAPVEMLDSVAGKVQIGVLDGAIIKEMDEISSDQKEIEKEDKEEKTSTKIAYEIVRESINKRVKEPKIKSKEVIKKAVREKIETRKIVVKETNTEIERKVLALDSTLRESKKNISGLFIKSPFSDSELIPVGKRLSKEELQKELKILDKYINSFKHYTNDYTDDYGKRIMEAIFFVFTSPFISEIRNKLTITENRLDVPQFLFIGGEAKSGKSSLLSMMSKMLSIEDKPYFSWKDLLGTSGNRQKKERLDLIYSWMALDESVAPIMIDEIDGEFFSKAEYGRDSIVEISNNCIKKDSSYPALIGTTNTKSYALPEEARRRSYYLVIDRVLNTSQESIESYKEISEEINNSLFLDFVLRMAEKIEDSDVEWDMFSSDNKFDFLHNTRKIFEKYYEEAEMPLPRYFPEDRYSDDKETNKEKWRKLYLGSKDVFKYDKNTGNIFFKIVDLNLTDRKYGPSSAQIYAEALPQKVVVGSVHGVTNIELKTDDFLEWINVPNEYNTNPIKKFFKKFS